MTIEEEILARLQVLLPDESDTALLAQLITDAEQYVLAYTCRGKVPAELVKTVGDLALIAYNRRGTEGETSRSEGGESYNFNDAPKEIYGVLDRFRLARVGGKVYEKTETDEG